MSRWTKGVLLAVVGAVAGLFAISAFFPASYSASRALTVRASAPVIFELADRVRSWEQWSVWTAKEDPSLRYRYEGPERGRGATVHWTADELGDGRRVVTEVDADRRIAFDLFFGGPRPAKGVIELAPDPEGTRVSWSMTGDFGLMLPLRLFREQLETMVGRDLERSLVGLKKRAEDIQSRLGPDRRPGQP